MLVTSYFYLCDFSKRLRHIVNGYSKLCLIVLMLTICYCFISSYCHLIDKHRYNIWNYFLMCGSVLKSSFGAHIWLDDSGSNRRFKHSDWSELSHNRLRSLRNCIKGHPYKRRATDGLGHIQLFGHTRSKII